MRKPGSLGNLGAVMLKVLCCLVDQLPVRTNVVSYVDKTECNVFPVPDTNTFHLHALQQLSVSKCFTMTGKWCKSTDAADEVQRG